MSVADEDLVDDETCSFSQRSSLTADSRSLVARRIKGRSGDLEYALVRRECGSRGIKLRRKFYTGRFWAERVNVWYKNTW